MPEDATMARDRNPALGRTTAPTRARSPYSGLPPRAYWRFRLLRDLPHTLRRALP